MYDPLLILAAQRTEAGVVAAIWQVETDPDAALGALSGAWIVDPSGIRGFAAQAEWLEGREDRRTMLATLLRFPVLAIDAEAAALAKDVVDSQELHVPVLEAADLDRAAAEERQVTIADEAQLLSERTAADGKKRKASAWPALGNLADAIEQAQAQATVGANAGDNAGDNTGTNASTNAGHHAGTELPAGEEAVVSRALGSARALLQWIQAWNTFDKTRVRKLGASTNDIGMAKYNQPRGIPTGGNAKGSHTAG